MADAKKPKPGELSIDASDVKVVDLSPEQIKKLIKVRDGFEAAIACVLRLSTTELEQVGLLEKDVKALQTTWGEYTRVQELLPAAEKLVELLNETRLQRGHDLNVLLSDIATLARRRTERENTVSLSGKLEDLMNYHYGPAERAAETRSKNAAKSNNPPKPST